MSELEGISYFADRRRIQQPRVRIPDAPVPEHQRGMRSFLTWSFVLAQLVAAEQITGNAAAAATIDPSSGARASGDGAADAAALPDDASRTAVTDAEAGDRAAPVAVSAAVAQSTPFASSATAYAELPSAGDNGGAGDTSAVSAGAGTGHHVAGSSLPAHEGSDGRSTALDPVVPGLLSGVGGEVAVNLELGPLGGVGIDLGLEDSVALDLSALGLDIHLDLPLDLGSLLDTGQGSVGTVLMTAGDLTGPVLDVVGDISDAATETLGTVLTTAGDLTGPVLDVVGTATDGLGSALGSANIDGQTAAIGNGSLLSTLDGAVGSSGTIELASETIAAADASDSLFQGSTYTDLNITFQTLLPGQSPTAVSIEGTTGASASGSLLDTVLSSSAAGDSDSSAGSIDTSGGMSAALGLEDAVGSHRTLADLFG